MIPAGPFACVDVTRFTNLFGGICAGTQSEGPSIGAADPYEKVKDEESGPRLDLGLPCWDKGRMESRLIQDPREDMESRGTSDIGGGTPSPGRINEALLLVGFGGLVWEPVVGGSRMRVVVAGIIGRASWRPLGAVWLAVEISVVWVMSGRDEMVCLRGLSQWEVSFLLFEGGRGKVDSAGWPNTRPTAAAATPDPVPTSCVGSVDCQ